MILDWDDAKCTANLKKHGIDFIDILVVFEDSNRKEELQDVDGEERWRLIGATSDGLVVVIYVEQRTTIRIISARRANRHEQKLYHQGPAD